MTWKCQMKTANREDPRRLDVSAGPTLLRVYPIGVEKQIHLSDLKSFVPKMKVRINTCPKIYSIVEKLEFFHFLLLFPEFLSEFFVFFSPTNKAKTESL